MKDLQPQVYEHGKWINVGRRYTMLGAANGYLHTYLSGRRNVLDCRIINVQTDFVFEYRHLREWR